jgi:hypothetical protein
MSVLPKKRFSEWIAAAEPPVTASNPSTTLNPPVYFRHKSALRSASRRSVGAHAAQGSVQASAKHPVTAREEAKILSFCPRALCGTGWKQPAEKSSRDKPYRAKQ